MTKHATPDPAIRAGPDQYPDELMRFLEQGRRLPLRAILPTLGPLSGARLLDVGCGIGLLLRAAAGHGARPAGVERIVALLEIARWALPDADLRTGEPADLPFGDEMFDVVTAFDVFHSIDEDEHDTALAELGRVTGPGGRIAIGHWGQRPCQDLRPGLDTAGLRVVVDDEIDCADDVFHYLVTESWMG